jgi:protein arginine kinase activator
MIMNKCVFCDKICHTPIHVTEIVEGKVELYHICKHCGVEYMKGVASDLEGPKAEKTSPPAPGTINIDHIKSPVDLIQFISDVLGATPAKPKTPSKPPCQCGLTLEEFQKIGRFGCAKCYEHFYEEVERLVFPYHNADCHIGKCPTKKETLPNTQEEQLKLLKLKMAQAVELENYEDAARLKKEIESLTLSGPAPISSDQ